MTLGNKIKDIRIRLCLSQEDLASIMNVSIQAITKWESDNGVPDISNLKELSKVFNVSIDNLMSNEKLPLLKMKIELDKSKYKNILTSYKEVLDDYFKIFNHLNPDDKMYAPKEVNYCLAVKKVCYNDCVK